MFAGLATFMNRSVERINPLRLARDALVIDAVLILVLGVQYIGFPAAAGLLLHNYGFLTWMFVILGVLALAGAVFFRKRGVAVLNCIMLLVFSLLFLFMFFFFNGPFNVPLAVLSIVSCGLNGIAFVSTVAALSSKKVARAMSGKDGWFRAVDWRLKHPRGKIAALFTCIVTIVATGIGTHASWNAVITVQAPDGYKTVSSFWGPPSLRTTVVTTPVVPDDNMTLSVPGAVGTLAYVENVTIEGNDTNYCDYAAGATSFPNGTVRLSQELPAMTNVSIAYYNITNSIVLAHLNASGSTLIMNYHSTSHSEYPNGYWYHDLDFFASIERTYLFQVLDYWNIKYYLNVHNGIDFPHAFNYPGFIDLCYTMLDWFAHQNEQGLCMNVQGISPDFESGSHEKLWWDNQTSIAEPLFPGSLLPGIISQEEWYGLNCQDPALIAEATLAWEGVYTHARDLGYSTYVVFQGGAMRDIIDGNIHVTWLPIYPVSPNPSVRFGIMSYQDAQDNVAGGRYKQYRDCVDQITLFGDRGRSILTGWIADGTRWYTDDALGLGRYIEDVLVAQAAGMTEIFHAPLYRLQSKWGDDAVLVLHQALNEWPKQRIRIAVPPWEYRNDYNDALKNFNHWWLWLPVSMFLASQLLLVGTFKTMAGLARKTKAGA